MGNATYVNLPAGGFGVKVAHAWQPVDMLEVCIQMAEDDVFACKQLPERAVSREDSGEQGK
jgi:hypothetical protein